MIRNRSASHLLLTCTLMIVFVVVVAAAPGCRWNAEREAQAAESMKTTQRLQTVRSRLWRVTELRGQPVPEDAGITVQLRPDENKVVGNNRVVGSTGVNQYTGVYKLTPPSELAFSDIASTRRAGPPDAMAREQAFLNLMDQVRSFEMQEHADHRTVELRDAKGKPIMRAMTRDQ
jgi:heat shock protein HslJ